MASKARFHMGDRDPGKAGAECAPERARRVALDNNELGIAVAERSRDRPAHRRNMGVRVFLAGTVKPDVAVLS
jgi:hypothetical protein